MSIVPEVDRTRAAGTVEDQTVDSEGRVKSMPTKDDGTNADLRTLYEQASDGGFSGSFSDFLTHLRTATTVEDIDTDSGAALAKQVDPSGNPVPTTGWKIGADDQLSVFNDTSSTASTETKIYFSGWLPFEKAIFVATLDATTTLNGIHTSVDLELSDFLIRETRGLRSGDGPYQIWWPFPRLDPWDNGTQRPGGNFRLSLFNEGADGEEATITLDYTVYYKPIQV